MALLGFLNLAYVVVAWWSAPGMPRRYADYLPAGTSLPDGFFTYAVAQDQAIVRVHDQDYLAGLGWLAVLAIGIVGTAAWYAVAAKRTEKPYRTGRLVLGTAAAVLVLLLLDLAGWGQFGLAADVRGPMLATLALVALAAYERSVLVLVVAAVFVLVTVVVPGGAAGTLLAVAALLAGAFAVLLRRGRERPVTDA